MYIEEHSQGGYMKKKKIIPRETINKAIDYILIHLTAQISVDDVADF